MVNRAHTLLSREDWLIRVSANCTAAIFFLHMHADKPTTLTWHLIPAWLQPQWRGSQYKRQSQPHSSRERRMALSSAFSRASMRAMPEARRRARRRFVGSGWRKKQSSTSTPSTSRSSSDTSSRVSRSAWAHSTVPFLVSCGWQSVWAVDNKRLIPYLKLKCRIIILKTDPSETASSVA